MRKDLNIIEIIKKAPRKLKLYVSVLGKEIDNYEIKEDQLIIPLSNEEASNKFSAIIINSDGTLFNGGECVLFPSKEYRTWKHWQRVLFQEGEKITDGRNILEYEEGLLSWQTLDTFTWEEKEKIKPIFQVGQIIAPKNNKFKTPRRYKLIVGIDDDNYITNSYYGDSITDGIKLEISEQDCFEVVSPFEPFQRILVPVDGRWRASLFSNYDKENDCFVTTDGHKIPLYLLPYDGNEDLLGINHIIKK